MRHCPHPDCPHPETDLVTIASFCNPHSAHVARTCLEAVLVRPVVLGQYQPYSSLAAWVHLQVPADLASMARSRLKKSLRRKGAEEPEDHSWRRQRKIRWARGYLLAFAAMLLLSGTFLGLSMLSVEQIVSERLEGLSDDEVLGVDESGRPVTAADVRAEFRFASRKTFAAVYIPALLLLCLYAWARRSPFPALICLLCLWMVLETSALLVDPWLILEGALGRLFMMLILLQGLRAALTERRYRDGLSDRAAPTAHA